MKISVSVEAVSFLKLYATMADRLARSPNWTLFSSTQHVLCQNFLLESSFHFCLYNFHQCNFYHEDCCWHSKNRMHRRHYEIIIGLWDISEIDNSFQHGAISCLSFIFLEIFIICMKSYDHYGVRTFRPRTIRPFIVEKWYFTVIRSWIYEIQYNFV